MNVTEFAKKYGIEVNNAYLASFATETRRTHTYVRNFPEDELYEATIKMLEERKRKHQRHIEKCEEELKKLRAKNGEET